MWGFFLKIKTKQGYKKIVLARVDAGRVQSINLVLALGVCFGRFKA